MTPGTETIEAAPAGPPAAPRRCANCDAEAPGAYCARCGQKQHVDLRLPAAELAREALDEAVGADSRLHRTLGPLLLHPGRVTADYLAGRRARYTSPLKLYLVASAVFFLARALLPDPDAGAARQQVVAFQVVGPRLPGSEDGALRAAAALEGWLRRHGAFATRLADGVRKLAHEPGAASRYADRVDEEIAHQLPHVVFFLVPVLALLVRVGWRRAGRSWAEHCVFSLHAHTVLFLFLVPAAAVGGSATGVAALLGAGHAAAALRRLHGGGWGATLVRAAVVFTAYALLLAAGAGLVVAAVAVRALLAA